MGDRYWVCCISDAIDLVMVYNQQFHGTILLMFERTSREYVLLKTYIGLLAGQSPSQRSLLWQTTPAPQPSAKSRGTTRQVTKWVQQTPVSETTFDAGTHISPQEYRISSRILAVQKFGKRMEGSERNDKIMELYGGLVLWHLLNIPNG